ncbi:MAG: hypothetical protein Ct9H300mP31_19080 [Acidimicrobiaceae bacterium]|nr:MAG: hypothetical protein Ct9H300mP31_19080 [Acidimicrobiaceae bacterium]
MKLGFFGVNAGVVSDPEAMVAVAITAEAAGWESVWTGEHLVASSPRRPPSPVPPDTHFVDQVASLAFLAAHTRTLRLGTGIVILPQRNPVVLAKELASVDVLSGGRLEAGFGVGYVPDEFDAVGVPFSERGSEPPNTSTPCELSGAATCRSLGASPRGMVWRLTLAPYLHRVRQSTSAATRLPHIEGLCSRLMAGTASRQLWPPLPTLWRPSDRTSRRWAGLLTGPGSR